MVYTYSNPVEPRILFLSEVPGEHTKKVRLSETLVGLHRGVPSCAVVVRMLVRWPEYYTIACCITSVLFYHFP